MVRLWWELPAEPCLANAWRAEKAAGWTRQSAGRARQAAGVTWKAAGMPRQAAGLKRQPAGLRRQAAGLRRQADGLRRQAAGVTRQAAGLIRQTDGLRRQAAGLRRQPAGLRRKAAGLQRRPAGRTGAAVCLLLRRPRRRKLHAGREVQVGPCDDGEEHAEHEACDEGALLPRGHPPARRRSQDCGRGWLGAVGRIILPAAARRRARPCCGRFPWRHRAPCRRVRSTNAHLPGGPIRRHRSSR